MNSLKITFDISFYLKLRLLIFSKKQKCRHIKDINTPENDGKLKKCQLEESNLRPSLYEGDALPAELSWQKKMVLMLIRTNTISELRMPDSNWRQPD